MIINEKIYKSLNNLKQQIEKVLENNSLTDLQLESFLMNFEKSRYNLLTEIKLYNKNVKFEHEKIKTIDAEYKAELYNDILKIYVPEILPSFKNLKTHTYKRILLNVAEITKPFNYTFDNKVFIYIKVFDNIKGWDIDNKCIKPVADALILSNIIEDDNVDKMFYCVKGEYSENPHTEIYVFNSKNINQFLENIELENRDFLNKF